MFILTNRCSPKLFKETGFRISPLEIRYIGIRTLQMTKVPTEAQANTASAVTIKNTATNTNDCNKKHEHLSTTALVKRNI